MASSPFRDDIVSWTKAAAEQCDPDFVVLDSCYRDWNETWADLRLL